MLRAKPHGVLFALLAAFGGTQRASAQSSTPLASLSGVVLADSSERPIVGAEIALANNPRTVRTDASGAFSIGQVPPGRSQLIVRAIGYEPFSATLDVPVTGLRDIEILLQVRASKLERIDVRASASAMTPFLREFDERRRVGIGRFLDSTQLGRADQSQWPSEAIARLAGLRLVAYGGRRAFASTRGVSTISRPLRGDPTDRALGAPGACYVQVIVDGILRYSSTPNEPLVDVNALDVGRIVALEFYTVSQNPPAFNRGGNAPCGTLLLWTGR